MSLAVASDCLHWTGITAEQKLVLFLLGDQSDEYGLCYPSLQRIQKTSCLSASDFEHVIRRLEAKGLLCYAGFDADLGNGYYVLPGRYRVPKGHPQPVGCRIPTIDRWA